MYSHGLSGEKKIVNLLKPKDEAGNFERNFTQDILGLSAVCFQAEGKHNHLIKGSAFGMRLKATA